VVFSDGLADAPEGPGQLDMAIEDPSGGRIGSRNCDRSDKTAQIFQPRRVGDTEPAPAAACLLGGRGRGGRSRFFRRRSRVAGQSGIRGFPVYRRRAAGRPRPGGHAQMPPTLIQLSRIA
jgi:hypothetical protein